MPGPAPSPAPAQAKGQTAVAAAAAAPEDGGNGGERRVFASPLVRRIARQEGVDINQLEGSGWKGRVTKKDIEEHITRGGAPPVATSPAPAPAAAEAPATRPSARPSAPAPAPVSAAPPAAKPGERVRIVPMTNMQAKVAEHMVMSRRTSAHVTTVFEVDMTRVVEIREREKEKLLKSFLI